MSLCVGVACRPFHPLFVRRGMVLRLCAEECLCVGMCVCVYVCACRDYQLGQSIEVKETRVCCVMRHNKLGCFFGCMSVCVCVCVCVCVLEIRWALFLER